MFTDSPQTLSCTQWNGYYPVLPSAFPSSENGKSVLSDAQARSLESPEARVLIHTSHLLFDAPSFLPLEHI
jgi:hypothetical protein